MSLGMLRGKSQPGSVVSQPGDLVSVRDNVPVFVMPTARGKKKTRRVVLTQSMCGSDPKNNVGWVKNPGDVVEMLADEAERYVERGYASYLPE